MPAPALKAVLFDLDGTLIDSLADLAAAVNRMLDIKGYPRRELALFPKFIGEGMAQLVERALPETARDPQTVAECLAEYQRQYEAGWHDQTVVYDGMHEVITAARRQGLKVGCISNKGHHFTQLCCAHFFPAVTWDILFGQREGVPRKPDPAAALEAFSILGIQPHECAYVGDSGIDMEFAKAAGMRAVGVTWGFRGVDELRAAGADVLAETPEELLRMLEQSAS